MVFSGCSPSVRRILWLSFSTCSARCSCPAGTKSTCMNALARPPDVSPLPSSFSFHFFAASSSLSSSLSAQRANSFLLFPLSFWNGQLLRLPIALSLDLCRVRARQMQIDRECRLWSETLLGSSSSSSIHNGRKWRGWRVHPRGGSNTRPKNEFWDTCADVCARLLVVFGRQTFVVPFSNFSHIFCTERFQWERGEIFTRDWRTGGLLPVSITCLLCVTLRDASF